MHALWIPIMYPGAGRSSKLIQIAMTEGVPRRPEENGQHFVLLSYRLSYSSIHSSSPPFLADFLGSAASVETSAIYNGAEAKEQKKISEMQHFAMQYL
jgi:hypothetical protein